MISHQIAVVTDDEWMNFLLHGQESEGVEFKRAGKVASVIKSACAMANGTGGLIVLGLEDPQKAQGDSRLFGIEENPEAVGEIKRGFQESISPPLDLPETNHVAYWEMSVPKSVGKAVTLLIILIGKSNTVHSINNATYIRSGSQSRQIGPQEIHRLCLRRGVVSVVNQAVDIPIELLHTRWWQEYSDQRKLTRPIEDALKHIGLSVNEVGQWKPTMAAVLLFAEEPNGLLDRKCAIRIFHYRGHDVEYSPDPNLVRQPITVTGPVLKQIRETVEAVNREIDSGVQRTAQGFEIRQQYPRQVVQEAITNAVLHRDYSSSGDIKVRIFTNRIEIESPGLFPGAITAKNIGMIGSKPRNPKLTDHIREFPNPPNLDAGEGVRMMKMTMDSMGLYPPVFEEYDESNRQSVLVRISNEAKLSEWELVKDFLDTHDTISNGELRKILNQTANENYKASRMLTKWVETGLLRIKNPEAGTRSRRYCLACSTAGMRNEHECLNGFHVKMTMDNEDFMRCLKQKLQQVKKVFKAPGYSA